MNIQIPATASAETTMAIAIPKPKRGRTHVRRMSRTSFSIASARSPAMHQKTTSHDGASRPRKERSSTVKCAWQQIVLTAVTGDGQKTDRISSATNAAEASPRLASIDIEPFSDHLKLIDMPIAAQRHLDLFRVGTARRDDRGLSDVI